jgi:hypothetical protein
MNVEMKIGKETRMTPHTIGGQQGDNMAPLILLFLMQAFLESLKKWNSKWGIMIQEYRFMQSKNVERGCLLRKSI